MAAAPEEVQAWLSQYEVEGKALGKKGMHYVNTLKIVCVKTEQLEGSKL
jgi:hypothetical protein